MHGKDTDKGISYRPISLLSVLAMTLEKSLLPYIHTLIRKLLQSNIPDTIIKFMANYNNGRKAYTTYRNYTSRQRQFKLAFHKVASFHPHYLTFTPQTYHHPVHRFRSWPTQMTSPSHPYIRKVFAWTQQNDIILNPGKTTCTLFTPDPA